MDVMCIAKLNDILLYLLYIYFVWITLTMGSSYYVEYHTGTLSLSK